MKKISLLFPLLAIPFLAGCESTKVVTQLTFGTYMHDEAVQLSSSEFTTHVTNDENFLLAIYPKDSTCSCWRHFSNVIDNVVTNEHLLIYKFYAQDVDDNAKMKEIGGFSNRMNAPTFYIIRQGKIARFYDYADGNNFFKQKDEFLGELNNHVKKPKMFYLSKEQLEEKIDNNETFSVFYARNACDDCNYVIPHTLTPYFDSLERESNNLYVFDMQPYYGTEQYPLIKEEFGLTASANPTYGFGGGVVPTFHYIKDGEIKDACVYFNDGPLTNVNGIYHALGSYYNEERIANLHYLTLVENKDLTKIDILEADTDPYNEIRLWKNSSASVYHDAILKAFLNTYL